MSRRFTLHSEVSSISEEEDSFNLAVIGDSSVGKSTLICRLIKHWTEQSSKSHKKSKKRGNDRADLGIKGRSLTVDIVDTSTTKTCTFPQGLPSFDVYVLVYSLVCDGSFESVVAARDQILQQEGPSVPIVFVANKTDIAGSVDKTERMSRDLNISCEWEHGHVEISAEKDLSAIQVLEQIMNRHHKHVSVNDEKKTHSRLSKKFRSIRNLFLRKRQRSNGISIDGRSVSKITH